MTADQTGFETLQIINKADNFNKWMYSAIQPYCKGNILEIGSGIGNISQFFVSGNLLITLSDIDDDYLHILHKRFTGSGSVKEIFSIDLQKDDFTKTYIHLKEKYDTIFMLNVLEHLGDEDSAVRNCQYMLKRKGTLIILVPAYSWLYSNMDKELGHKKRYTAKKIKTLFCNHDFQITKVFYFNALGIPAWLYGKIRRLKKIPSTEMNLFDRLTGLGKIIDRILFNKAGLSVVCAGKKIIK